VAESAAPTSGRIFISYRREETAYPAGWLYDRLADHYGSGQIFKDVDSIELGDDFVEVITRAVGDCDVLLALVGDEWLTITDDDGRRRLDDPDDFVRLEIEAALTRNVRVIPILVGKASMPRADEVPASLAGLVRRQALGLSPARFDFDTNRLLKVLDQTHAEVRTAQASTAEPGTVSETGTRSDGRSVPVPVTLTVENRPQLAAEPATVDFGTVQVHGPSPQRIVRISNIGGGTLEARATSADSWLHLEQHGDQVLATVDTITSGEQIGAIATPLGRQERSGSP
jgi:TIR domain